MIRTFVCEKDGCSGNKFFLESEEDNLHLICAQCKSKYDIDVSNQDFIMLPNCSNCNNDTFKIFRDLDKEGVYVKCAECGSTPEKVYIDSDGIQVSYEIKLLSDIKEVMYLIEQRVCNLEMRIQDLERGQSTIEESLAYVNKYLIDKV